MLSFCVFNESFKTTSKHRLLPLGIRMGSGLIQCGTRGDITAPLTKGPQDHCHVPVLLHHRLGETERVSLSHPARSWKPLCLDGHHTPLLAGRRGFGSACLDSLMQFA